MYGGFCGPHKVFTTTLNPGMLGLDNAVVHREDSPDINTLLDLEGNEIHLKTKLENIFNSDDEPLGEIIDNINNAITSHVTDVIAHTDTQYTVVNNTTSTDSSEVLSAPQANPDTSGTLAGNINRMIAPYFSPTKNYVKGESCTYGNNVWLFYTNKPAGAWDATKCYPTSIYSQITGNPLSTDWFSIPSAATVNPDNYGFCQDIHNMIAPYYSIYKTYSLGEYVTYRYKIYKCEITVDSPESFTSSKWTEVASVTALINAIVSRLNAYDNSNLVMYRTTEGERTKMVDKNDQVLYTENLTKNIIDETTGVTLDVTLSSISNHVADTAKHAVYSVTKLATPVTGYISSYRLTADGVNVGDIINIPKDFLVKSGSVKTCTINDNPVIGYVVGDKYIDFVVNSIDNDATNSNIYIKVSDLIVNYTGGNGIVITDTSIAVKINPTSSNGLSVSNEGLSLDLVTSTTPGAMSSDDKVNLDAATLSMHSHSNKNILDATTASFTTEKDSKLSNIEAMAEVNVIEEIIVNGVPLTVSDKSVTIEFEEGTLVEDESSEFGTTPETRDADTLEGSSLDDIMTPINNINNAINGIYIKKITVSYTATNVPQYTSVNTAFAIPVNCVVIGHNVTIDGTDTNWWITSVRQYSPTSYNLFLFNSFPATRNGTLNVDVYYIPIGMIK